MKIRKLEFNEFQLKIKVSLTKPINEIDHGLSCVEGFDTFQLIYMNDIH